MDKLRRFGKQISGFSPEEEEKEGCGAATTPHRQPIR